MTVAPTSSPKPVGREDGGTGMAHADGGGRTGGGGRGDGTGRRRTGIAKERPGGAIGTVRQHKASTCAVMWAGAVAPKPPSPEKNH